MLFMTVSAIALIGSIQLAFRGRGYLYRPGELRDWWTDETAPTEELLRQEQRDDFALWLRWMHRATTAYNLGIVLLGCGMLGLLAPPEVPRCSRRGPAGRPSAWPHSAPAGKPQRW